MPRKHFVIEDDAAEKLPELAEREGMTQGKYISYLIRQEYARQKGELQIDERLHRMDLREKAMDQKLAILLDASNSFYHQFETGATAENFRSVDDDPHPWIEKGYEFEEHRRRKANFKKLKNPPTNKYEERR